MTWEHQVNNRLDRVEHRLQTVRWMILATALISAAVLIVLIAS